MKIEQINMYYLRMPLVAPFETSFGREEARDCLIIEVSSEGLVGYGEAVADRDPGYSSETAQTSWHILSDFVFPFVIGQDINSAEDLDKVFDTIRGNLLAKAGLEMAIWDLIGKRDGRSLQSLLGGVQRTVDVGVSVGLQESPAVLVKTVAEYLDQGYRRIKIKIKPGRDIGDTKAVREAFPNLRLQVDANSAYQLEDIDTLLPLDDLNLLLIEQPLWEDDLWDHRILQQKMQTPICLDESIHTVRHARQALEMGSCKIINIKPGRVGGLQQGKAVHDFCLARNVPVWCGGMLETGVGRAANLAIASLPGFTLPGDISASSRYYKEDITEERFELNKDSTIDVPTGVGLGIHINQDALNRATINRAAFR
jgi:o-succinylbenzoate synthase